MTTSKTTLMAAMAMGLAGIVFSTSAKASDFSIGVGFNRPTAVVETRAVDGWIPAHYENRIDRVLVSAGHYEDNNVAAVYETRTDRFGHAVRVLVQPASCTPVWVGDQFEDRSVSVLVPGRYVESYAPVVTSYGGYRTPNFAIGVGFGHDRDRHDYRDYGHDYRNSGHNDNHDNHGSYGNNRNVPQSHPAPATHDSGHAGHR